MRCYTIQFASDFIIDPGLGDIDFPVELRQIFDLGLFIPFVVDVFLNVVNSSDRKRIRYNLLIHSNVLSVSLIVTRQVECKLMMKTITADS